MVQGEIYFVEVFDTNAPNTFAPQSLYDLTIINRPAPVPFELDLRVGSDTGSDDSDDVTADDTPTIQLRVDDVGFLAMGIDFSPTDDGDLTDDAPGFKVRVFDNGNPAGFATPVAGQPGVYGFTFSAPLAEGPHSLTARVVIVDPANPPDGPHAVGPGAESDSLLVTIVTTPPAAPVNPRDLLPSSDSAGIDDDDITTIMAAGFQGTAEANAIVRIRADGVVVGEGKAASDATDGVLGNGLGHWEITVEPLAEITAEAENAAGLISDPSDALQVTIANQILNLAGADATVVVDLATSTLTGYPGIPGGGVVGILGIPQVNLDASSNALSFLGTTGPDDLVYSPTGDAAGSLTRASSSQVINFSSVGGGLSIDPLGGADVVTVRGTIDTDTISVVADPTTTVQVNALLAVDMPIAEAERVIVEALEGEDQTEVQVPDTVNAHFEVHGGTPTSNQRLSDVLEVVAISPSPKLLKQSGAGVKGSGSIFVSYPRTTGNETRVDYVDVEKVRTDK